MFRRHVGDRPHHCSGAGQILFVDRTCLRVESGNLAGGTGHGRNLGQPKVENLGVAAFGHENICGLDVTVDDALAVCGIEGVADFDSEREQNLEIERASRDAVFES